jgi:predicted kinase
MKAILTVGIPASGKTSWAWTQVASRIERDELREEMFGRPYKFSKEREKAVTEQQHQLITSCAALGEDIIISDTNINPKTRKSLQGFLEGLGYEVELKFFPISYEQAVKRDLQRDRSVGANVIWTMFKSYNEQFGIKPYISEKHLKGAIICDIDGTLAHIHNRSPYEWGKVAQDKPNKLLIRMLNNLRMSGIKVFIFSGRDEVCRKETKDWLHMVGVTYDHLSMRPEGSTDKDFDVKYRMFNEHIRDKYQVVAVFDDRPQVCRLWNLLELPLYKLGSQKEF